MSKGILIDRVGLLFFLENVLYDVAARKYIHFLQNTVVIEGGFYILRPSSFAITVVLTRLGEIPVPIPNTEVKSKPVDDT